jgi:hypothetical protein
MSKLLTFLMSVWLPLAAIAADKKPKPTAPAKAARPAQQKAAGQVAAKTQAQASNQAAREAQQALNAPFLMHLAQMSPEERDAALARLPPARRQMLEQRLENFAKRPADQQARVLNQYERLQALPPERREQAREALAEYNSIMPPRKGIIGIELNRLSSMTDEQRASVMSAPRFRLIFSEAEIQMMKNLNGIVP